ncbi:MAG: hypothetical protein ABI874_04340 [Chloroflexota bacterium]
MHKYLRYGWFDNLDMVRHIPVGEWRGIKVSVTPTVWLFPFVFFLFRFALVAFDANLTVVARFSDAVIFTLGVAVFTLVHAGGHMVSGLLVGSPMDELLFTATRAVNIYHGDQSFVPGRAHVARAVGGPAANLISVPLLYLLLPLAGSDFLAAVIASAAATSLFAGLGSFLPLPSIDGQVIWRELLRPLRAAI